MRHNPERRPPPARPGEPALLHSCAGPSSELTSASTSGRGAARKRNGDVPIAVGEGHEPRRPRSRHRSPNRLCVGRCGVLHAEVLALLSATPGPANGT